MDLALCENERTLGRIVRIRAYCKRHTHTHTHTLPLALFMTYSMLRQSNIVGNDIVNINTIPRNNHNSKL
jgi:hypothetical protein